MLLRFGVSNDLSIRDFQELLLTASSLKDADAGLIACPSAPTGHVVPAAVIYGANAAGKTNLYEAIYGMREMVLYSHTRGEPDGGVPHYPFLLDPKYKNERSCFEMDFVIDDVRYLYGFEASDAAFESEWLHASRKSRRRTLFQRNGGDFRFGRGLKGENRLIAKLTRPNSLYVSVAAQNKHEELSRVYSFFRSFKLIGSMSVSGDAASVRFAKREPDRRIVEFLGSMDTGAIDFRRKETALPDNVKALRRNLTAAIQETMGSGYSVDSDTGDKRSTIELGHRDINGENVYFDLRLESAGTRRLLMVLDYAFDALDNGALLAVDELDASLHTRAAESLLELFCSRETNGKGAQIIATTHDTNLMNSSLLRRDQLWFTEKDAAGATQLYPLTDIRTRKGDNIEQGYLQGRFGAVPPRRARGPRIANRDLPDVSTG